MIIIMKPQASKEAVEKVTSLIESKGLQAHLSEGSQVTIVGVVGDKSRLAGSNIPTKSEFNHFEILFKKFFNSLICAGLSGFTSPRFKPSKRIVACCTLFKTLTS